MIEFSDLASRELYRDLAEAGSLKAALEMASQERGIDLGEVTAPEGDAGLVVAWFTSSRGGIGISLAAEERLFLIKIEGKGHGWATGGTPVLLDAARTVEAWRRGASLQALKSAFPFMGYTRLAQAFEEGNPTAVRWQELIGDGDLDDLRPLLVTAHRHLTLGKLFPSVTHLTLLRLAIDPSDRSAGEAWIALEAGSSYSIGASWAPESRRASSVDDAIAEAAEILTQRQD
ncbi:hypothetical protein ACFFWC_16260 [Plantactinospora siamensis]|uniref:Uncharacterized protein n=1 Tax=Plantactinospora siamensis TaxID=555372 RepID=A0ABV6NVG4_9ACTN